MHAIQKASHDVSAVTSGINTLYMVQFQLQLLLIQASNKT